VLNIVDDSGRWPSDSVSVEIAKKWPEVKPDLKSSFTRKADSGLGDVRIVKDKHGLPILSISLLFYALILIFLSSVLFIYIGKLKVFVCLLVSRSHETMEIDPKALKEGLKTVSLLAKMKCATVHVSNLTLASTNIEWDQMESLLGKLFADKKVFVYTGVVPGKDDPAPPPSSSKKNVTSSSSSSTSSTSKKTQGDSKKSFDPDATQEMEVEDEGPPTPCTSSASSSSNNKRKDRKHDSEEEEKNTSPRKKPAETKKGSSASAGAMEGTRVYFHGKLETVQNLDNMKRHVYFHNGEVCDTFDELTTHVVGDAWDSVRPSFPHFSSPFSLLIPPLLLSVLL
jgi:hypothetical protein